MERKTFIDNDGFYIDGINGKVWSDIRGRFRGKAIDRLAAYEDTGLEPQTISEILDSVSEWYDAHKEGRLLVLPIAKTNADKIRQMSDEELADYLGVKLDGCVGLPCIIDDNTDCQKCWIEWLKQEVESDA